MTKRNELEELLALQSDLTRREEARVPVQLPCRLLFPGVWTGSSPGHTENLHRSGVSVVCHIEPEQKMPSPGDTGCVHIELPAGHGFPPKYIRCFTTLVRVNRKGESLFQLAMQISNVEFAEFSTASHELMDLDPESCRYLM